MFQEALAQWSKGATFLNAMLQKKRDFSQVSDRGMHVTYSDYHKHIQTIKYACEYLEPDVR